jgi:hypothetical protein
MKRLKLSTSGRRYDNEALNEFVCSNGLNRDTFNNLYGLLYSDDSGFCMNENEPYRMFDIVDESKFTIFMMKYPQLILSVE